MLIITIGQYPPQKAKTEFIGDGLRAWLPLGEFTVDGITYLAGDYDEYTDYVTAYRTNYGAMFSVKADGTDAEWRNPQHSDNATLESHRNSWPQWKDLEWTPDIPPEGGGRTWTS